jgi:hypothetical protein
LSSQAAMTSAIAAAATATSVLPAFDIAHLTLRAPPLTVRDGTDEVKGRPAG